MNIALLHFLSSDGTTEESSISGKLYMLFAFIRWWGGGGYPCKRQQYEHLKEKKKQAFIFRETVGVYDRNGRANLIP